MIGCFRAAIPGRRPPVRGSGRLRRIERGTRLPACVGSNAARDYPPASHRAPRRYLLGTCVVSTISPRSRFRIPDYARSSARPRGFPGSRASLLGARASSPRQARESGATSTVRGQGCPRSQEDQSPPDRAEDCAKSGSNLIASASRVPLSLQRPRRRAGGRCGNEDRSPGWGQNAPPERRTASRVPSTVCRTPGRGVVGERKGSPRWPSSIRSW